MEIEENKYINYIFIRDGSRNLYRGLQAYSNYIKYDVESGCYHSENKILCKFNYVNI